MMTDAYRPFHRAAIGLFFIRWSTSDCRETKRKSRCLGYPSDGENRNKGNAKFVADAQAPRHVRVCQLCRCVPRRTTYSGVSNVCQSSRSRIIVKCGLTGSSFLRVRNCRASVDCVRLWNTSDLWLPDSNMKKTKSGVPFRIVAGHHGGTVSSICTLFHL
jgi:hypothetical protein